jgi:hypothetical protein
MRTARRALALKTRPIEPQTSVNFLDADYGQYVAQEKMLPPSE